MKLTRWRRVAAVVEGDDLRVVAVSGSPLGAAVTRGLVVRSFLSLSQEEARAALAPVAGAGRIILMCPSNWCAIRPIQITASQWSRAKDEVAATLDRLVPMDADDTLVGLVDLVGAEGDVAGGSLVALRRSRAQVWIDALERALDRTVTELLSPHMATLGLGLQHEAKSVVIERSIEGEMISSHLLVYGRPMTLDEPASAHDEQLHGVTPTGDEWAQAAALASIVAPGSMAPLVGRVKASPKRWLAPSATAAAALVVLFAAAPTYRARLHRAADVARAQQTKLADALSEAQMTQRQTERRIRLLKEGVQAPTAGWTSVLPTLLQTQSAIGEEGYCRRIEINPDRVTLRGEAPSASETLEKLEASAMLESALQIAPTSKSSQSGMDMFEIGATRVGGGGTPG